MRPNTKWKITVLILKNTGNLNLIEPDKLHTLEQITSTIKYIEVSHTSKWEFLMKLNGPTREKSVASQQGRDFRGAYLQASSISRGEERGSYRVAKCLARHPMLCSTRQHS